MLFALFFSTAAQAWEFAGWYGGGMYPALVPDPKVEGRLYLSSDVAGLWRSDDRGEHWRFINAGLHNFNVVAIAIAPSDTDVLYAGTPAGIARSDDGGGKWTFLGSTKDMAFIRPDSHRSIAVSARDHRQVYAGTAKGDVFVSSDAGATWKALGRPFKKETAVTALALLPDALFAASGEGLRKYDLVKKSWPAADFEEKNVHDLFYDPSQKTLYAACQDKIAFSRDGKTWAFSKPLPKGQALRISVAKGRWLAAWFKDWEGGVYLSEDAGKSWRDVEENLGHDLEGDPTRAWMRGFEKPNSAAVDPFDAAIFYYTDSWGVWRSDDAGKSWQEKIKGAPNSSGSDLYIGKDGEIFVASMDDGLLKSADGGKSYEAVFPNASSPAGSAGHVWRVLQKKDGSLLVSASPWSSASNLFFASAGGGKSFAPARKGLPERFPKNNTMWAQGYIRALAASWADENILYAGLDGDDGGGIYRSQDGGRVWEKMSGQPASSRVYNGLAVDPADPGRIYWGACGPGGGVYVSEDGGGVWRRALSELGWVFDIRAASDGRVYAAGGDGRPALYVSGDRGKSWSKLFSSESGDAMEAIAIDPADPARLAVGVVSWNGSGGKIFFSSDAGKSWKEITAGLPENAGPAAMAFHPKDGFLYVLLYAGSVYKAAVS